MIYRIPTIILLLALGCVVCNGQTSFQEIAPGTSTRIDVAKVFGQPVRTISATLFEYTPPEGIAKVEVGYSRNSLVDRIEVHFFKRISRPALIKKLDLPQQPESTSTNADGKLAEYFGGSSLLVMTYAAADASSGVSRISYYSRELFDNTLAKAGRARQNPGTQANTSQSGSGTAVLGEINLPGYMRPPAGSTSASTDSTGRTSTSGNDTSAAGSGEVKRTTNPKRSSTASGTILPMTVATPFDGGLVTQPSTHPGTTGDNNSDSIEMEIDLSATELRRFVGEYQFIQPSMPGLKPAGIALVSGKLRLTMGSEAYTLAPISGDKFVVGENGDVFSFKAPGTPGVKVYFLVSEDRIEKLFIVENQRQPKRFSVAVPKP